MSSNLDILYQLIPIIFGIGFFLLIKSFNFTKSKINIEPLIIGEQQIEIPQLKDSDAEEDKLILRDMLIIRGKLPVSSQTNLAAFAYNNAGIITYSYLDLPKSHLKIKQNKMTFVINDSQLIIRKILTPNPTSGIILSYYISGDLEIVN